MESKDITIERAHKAASKVNGKILNYKDKDSVLNQ